MPGNQRWRRIAKVFRDRTVERAHYYRNQDLLLKNGILRRHKRTPDSSLFETVSAQSASAQSAPLVKDLYFSGLQENV